MALGTSRYVKETLSAFIIRLHCKSLPCAIEKVGIRIRMRKRTRIRAFGSVPYISLNFDFYRIRASIRICAYGFLALS